MSKSIILLSGGLDSLVALGAYKENYNIELALTFDYGQKAAKEEINTSKNICKHYGIKHKIIRLDWLKNITDTALVSKSKVPDKSIGTKESAKSVWVPNRNALFLNIAAAFADAQDYDYIIFGANKDEAENFSDNTEEFRKNITELFRSSTLKHPAVIAPLINCSKGDIVKIATENDVPLNMVRSCYNSGHKHCGKCESCLHLKRALIENNCENYIRLLFKDDKN